VSGEEGLEAAADYRITGAIAAGWGQTFLIRGDGTALAAGRNQLGQLGIGSTTPDPGQASLTPVAGVPDIQQIAISWEHGLALDGQHRVWAWGSNDQGELGIGSSDSGAHPSPVQVQFQGLAPTEYIVAVDAGNRHSLALDSSGHVWSWGSSFANGLGHNALSPEKISPSILSGISQIAVSMDADDNFGNSSFALQTNGASSGTLWSWGTNNSNGQLGRTTSPLIPGQIPGLDEVTAVVAGGFHGLALRADKTVWAWGWNDGGQIGDGFQIDRMSPVPVANLSDVHSIAAGYDYSFAIREDGVLFAWGNNLFDTLGHPGDTTELDYRLLPGPVALLHDVVSVDGGAKHSVALTADGHAWIWGYNDHLQFGIASSPPGFSVVPLQVANYSAADGAWLSGDFDGDGLSNGREASLGTDPGNPDTNGDGVPDGAATAGGLSAIEADMDGDTVSNIAEVARGTNPLSADTDGDGFDDAADAFPLDPLRKTFSEYDPLDEIPPVIMLEEPKNVTPS
jgi:alpha-tubulin suppressor-like RCC1 family protein